MQTMMFKSLDRGPIVVSAARFSHAQAASGDGGMARVTLYFDVPDLPEVKKNFETPQKAKKYLEQLQESLATDKPVDLDAIADRVTKGTSSASQLRQF